MTTFLFIRHGQTEWNAQGRWQGFTDIPLNETGRAQAQALAKRLASWPLNAVYSSDLVRAAETAQALATPHNLQPILDAHWRERGLGQLEGLTQPEIRQKFPYLVLPRTYIEAPEGESYEKLQKRVLAGYKKLLRQHGQGETVAVVSHGGTLRMIISHVLGLPERLYAPFTLDGNTGITRVVLREGHADLTLLNDTAHLEGEEWKGGRD